MKMKYHQKSSSLYSQETNCPTHMDFQRAPGQELAKKMRKGADSKAPGDIAELNKEQLARLIKESI